MLSIADAELAARDEAIPGLATLLDAEALASALRTAVPEAEIGAARTTYVHYKPGLSCLAAYQFQLQGAEVDVYAIGYGAEGGAKFAKAGHKLGDSGPLGPAVVTLDEVAVGVYAFPHDRKLQAVGRLADEEARRKLLRDLLPDRPDAWDAKVCTLSYKPERRYVGRVANDAGTQAVIKVYGEQASFREARDMTRVFQSRGPLRIAQRLGRSGRHRAYALEWLPGRVLDEAAREATPEDAVMRTVGAALAEIHAQSLKGLTPRTREEEAATLEVVAADVAALNPSLAVRARDLASRLAAKLLAAPAEYRSIHGDFSAHQIVVDGDRAGVIDLDCAVAGDPAADLGWFMATLERDMLNDLVPPDTAKEMTEALLGGYCTATGGDLPPRIGLYHAAGLLSRVIYPFWSRKVDWPGGMEAILERAEEIEARG